MLKSIQSSTLVDLLHQRSRSLPQQKLYTFLLDGESQEQHLTYQQLAQQAQAIGVVLQNTTKPGTRVLLLYPPGLDYITAFFGCLYAGVIAVPAYPPDPTRLERTLPRLQAIAQDAQATIALTTSPILAMAEFLLAQSPNFPHLEWLATDVIKSCSTDWQPAQINGDTVAFLQYTSGSTAAPKGVILSHDNLLHNSALIYDCFGHSPQSQGVIWLPPYHDMGLIGGIIQPLYGEFPVTLLSPIDFLKQPLRWLQAISHYQASTSGGPNFAYDLCVRKTTPEQRATLDLSSWQVAFNGAEPIRHQTLEAFASAFAPCGFRKEAFYPCYGLAEATLIVSGGAKAALPITQTIKTSALAQNRVETIAPIFVDAQTLVSCGRALYDQQIAIVTPDTLRTRPPEQVGEVWVRGPSVAQGYWRRSQETQNTFQAHLADTGQGPFLRTGDLGFIQDDELFITGRTKDLIIIRGRNHYPQDIEQTVGNHPALRPGCGAAFSVDVDGQEQLVIVQEIRPEAAHLATDEIIRAIRQAVTKQHELEAYGVLLLQPRSIPKTSSGKIQRHACRAGFLAGDLDTVAESTLDISVPEAPTDQPQESFIRKALATVNEPATRQSLLTLYLQEQVARLLRLSSSQVNVQQPINALGLDSLKVIELQHSIETGLGVTLSMESLLQDASIAQHASDLLNRWTEAKTAPETALAPISPPLDESPLSHGQRALWFLNRLAPDNTAYNLASAVQIRGEVDVPALRQAFQSMVDYHPALRTTFAAPHGEPIQRISEHAQVHFQEKDACAWTVAQLNQRLIEKTHQPFNLERGPLLRVHLFRRSAKEHTLLLTIHHIVADLWSLAILAHTLDQLYAAKRSGITVSLSPPTLQYADFVRWQAQELKGPQGEQLWEYWREQLAGELPVLNLPTDRPRPSIQTFRGASETLRISPATTHKLKALAQTHGATLYMTLLAAFQVLLYRYTGQTDILVGSPTTGRQRAELTDLVGYFVNPVALRVNLAGNPTLTAFLNQVRQTVLSALAHQAYPLALLVERLQPLRDPSRSPLFQVMFVLQKTPQPYGEGLSAFALGEVGAQIDLGGLKLTSLALEQRIAQFDLTLAMAEVDDGLLASFQYNSDLFEAKTIARMAKHLQTLLQGIVADPQQRLSELPLLTQAERRQLLVTWNDTKVKYPRDRCVHQLFESQVERTPEAIAVIWKEDQLTYQQLNQCANQLAHYLQELGVGPEVRVGIFVERSLEMLIGILGILKAGGAYVPLDLTYPPQRLAFIRQDAKMALLLTQVKLSVALDEQETPFVCLDESWEQIADKSKTNPVTDATADNLAYVIFTSGSTGQPKGVPVQHGSLLNLVHWHQSAFAISASDRATQVAGPAFDASVWELWPYLTMGASVHIPDEEIRAAPARLRDWLVVQGITISFLPTPLAEAALTLEWPHDLALRTLLTGGDKLHHPPPPSLPFQLVNNYGPSEYTVVSTSGRVLPQESANRPPSIGRPIYNTDLYLLCQNLQPVPVGVSGELYIGGSGLARGYLGRPKLTAERFIPNPFSDEPGTRLYQTGDLARYRPNGELEFLGRTDHQVKIRGFRIELGEVEVALREHPKVEETTITVWGDEPGEQRLVAYIVGRQQSVPDAGESSVEAPAPTISELRSFLKTRLPDHMVPSVFIPLPALPLTPNGKIDQRALPVPNAAWSELDSRFVAARTPVEKKLVQIWAEALKVDRVGIYDNFFELGGHSLLATQIMHRVHQVFHVDPPLVNLLADPTIAHLAAVIEQYQAELHTGQQEPVRQSKSRIRALARGKGNLDELVAKIDQLVDSKSASSVRD